MVERRNAVFSADEVGDVKIIANRLYDLQRHVTSHMNTDMGNGVFLEASYRRDVQAAYTKASGESNPNGNIYKAAQDVCAPQFTSYSYVYLQCVTNELSKYPTANELRSSAALPKDTSYRHVYVSPVWSPDFAGWSVIFSIVIFTMIIARLTSVGVLKLILRYRYKTL